MASISNLGGIHMTEFELDTNIEAILSSTPCQMRNKGSRAYRRRMKVRKNDLLLGIINRGGYNPHAGYVDWDFEGRTLLHSGKYIKYPKNSNCQRWIKRYTSKRMRKCPYLPQKGNHYRRLFDYWWTLY